MRSIIFIYGRRGKMSVFHLNNSNLEVYELWAVFLLRARCGVPNWEGLGGGGGEGDGTRLQYSCLETPTDGGAWWAAVHGVAKSQTWLSVFTFTFHFPALEKEMATHSSVLAWRIPGMVEPGGLPSMGSHRVRHDWSDLAATAAAAGRRWRKWITPQNSSSFVP